MPRQSDVYATLGAPGIYQATPCIPFRLPNVYVFPPEEDDQDAYCLFHSGSASPTAFESFYGHPVYTQRDPNSPTFTDLRALNHALSYFQPSTAYGSARHGPMSSWESEERIQNPPPSRNFSGSTMSSASSRSSLSDSLRGGSAADAESHIRSNARYHVETKEGDEEQLWPEESTATSRRSSVFGDRDYDLSNYRGRGEDQPVSKKAQTVTLKSRAVTALKGFGHAMTRRLEGDALVSECRKEDRNAHAEPAIQESWFEPSDGLRRKRSRRTLGRLLGSRSNVDIHSISDGGVDEVAAEVSRSPRPSSSPSSGWDPSLNKRNSMTQLFGLTGSSVGIKAKTVHSHLDADKCGVTAAGDSKLPRRKSLTQLLGLGRGERSTASSDHTIMPADADGELSPTITGSLSNSSMLPRSERSGSPVSLATSGATAPLPNRRKSFLSKRSFSFLDLHCRFATDAGSRPSQTLQIHHHTSPAAPPMDSTVPFSPDSLSERTSSSSVVVSTEYEQTTDDEMRFPESHAEVVHIPGIVRESGGLAKDLGPSLISGVRLDLSEDSSFLSSFGLGVPDEDDVEGEVGEGHPTMELAVRLDSLNFDQLMFDPQTFMGAIYD